MLSRNATNFAQSLQEGKPDERNQHPGVRAVKRTLGIIAVAAALVFLGANYAMGAWHLGAPNFYAGWHCPPGTFLNTWWVRVTRPYPGESYMWHGWREIGGCASSLKVTAG